MFIRLRSAGIFTDKLPGLFVFAVCNAYKVGWLNVVVDEGRKTKSSKQMTSDISQFLTVYARNQTSQRLMRIRMVNYISIYAV